MKDRKYVQLPKYRISHHFSEAVEKVTQYINDNIDTHKDGEIIVIDYYNDIDFFVFTPTTTGNYGFNTESTLDEDGNSSTTLDVRLAIYDSTGTLMANSSSAYGEAYAGACYLIANKNYFIKFWTGSHQKCTSILRIQQLY